MKKYPKAHPENLLFKQWVKALGNTEWSYDCTIFIETEKIFLKIWLCIKLAWKLPHSKQVSQVSFQSSSPTPQTKFRCHLFHGECKTLHTATGARLSQAWGPWMLQSCLPAPTAPAFPVETPAPFGRWLGALGQEPPTARSQSCRRYKDMDHQRLNPASAEGWTRHTWSRALLRAELPLLPSIWPRKVQSSILRDFSGAGKSKRHTNTHSLCHWELSLTQVPDASITHHSFSSRWNSTTSADTAAEIKSVQKRVYNWLFYSHYLKATLI